MFCALARWPYQEHELQRGFSILISVIRVCGNAVGCLLGCGKASDSCVRLELELMCNSDWLFVESCMQYVWQVDRGEAGVAEAVSTVWPSALDVVTQRRLLAQVVPP